MTITIREFIDLARKGDNMTVREQKTLHQHLGNLRDVPQPHLTPTQQLFVARVLPSFILEHVPLLKDVLRVYDLSLDTDLAVDV
jgi:hypothetical protein